MRDSWESQVRPGSRRQPPRGAAAPFRSLREAGKCNQTSECKETKASKRMQNTSARTRMQASESKQMHAMQESECKQANSSQRM